MLVDSKLRQEWTVKIEKTDTSTDVSDLGTRRLDHRRCHELLRLLSLSVVAQIADGKASSLSARRKRTSLVATIPGQRVNTLKTFNQHQ